MSAEPDSGARELAQRIASVRAYHQRSKHTLQRYAAGPDTLDWDAQPDPFRRWDGAPLTLLPLVADELDAPWPALFQPGTLEPAAFNRSRLGGLLELSMGLAAWKQVGPDRWAVRCTPSSGNLHPTEAWLITQGVRDLADGLHHYAPREHGLELRAEPPEPAAPGVARVWVALSSIHWREAWKYGERAFRYCQLDIGHALGALRYAAALQGWRLDEVDIDHRALATLLGLDRETDYGLAEREDPDLLLELRPANADTARQAVAPAPWPAPTRWRGQANRLDHRPMYRWPVITEVARASAPGRRVLPVQPPRPLQTLALPDCSTLEATRCAPAVAAGASALDGDGDPPQAQPWPPALTTPAAQLIRQRRSAQRFDARACVPLSQVMPILAALASQRLPLDLPTARATHVHPIVFVQRVDGLAAGAYLLPRRPEAEALLRQHLAPTLDWTPVALPAPWHGLRLLRLAENPALAGTLRTLNCHQALGSDAVLGFALLGEFDALLGPEPTDPAQPPAAWHYRHLFHEAGLLGQVLYMEAEAAGLAGTGIGCYFDDSLHQLVGLQGSSFQSVYHFTVGVRVADARISTEAPYAHRPRAGSAAHDSAIRLPGHGHD